MRVDSQLLFSDAQAVTATAVSTNVIDFNQIRDIGIGEPLFLVVSVAVAMTDASSDSTVAVSIETDDNVDFNSATVVRTIGTFAAVSAAGTQLIIPIARGDFNERYGRLRYTVAGGSLTTGSFDAFICRDPDQDRKYADNITIS